MFQSEIIYYILSYIIKNKLVHQSKHFIQITAKTTTLWTQSKKSIKKGLQASLKTLIKNLHIILTL